MNDEFDTLEEDSSAGELPPLDAFRRSLIGLAAGQIVTAIAAQKAEACAAEARMLMAISVLAVQPCMVPLPPWIPEPLDGDGRVGDGPGSAGLLDTKVVKKLQARSPRPLDNIDMTEAEIAAKLRLEPYAAGKLTATALTLTARLPGTLAALSTGAVDLYRAQIIEKHTMPLADDRYEAAIHKGLSPAEAEEAARKVAGQVEEKVLRRTPDQAPKRLHRACTSAVIKVDLEFVERQRQERVRGRYVSYRPSLESGRADLVAHLPAVEAQAAYGIVDGYARLLRSQGDARTLDQLRADTLAYLIVHGHLPDQAPATDTNAADGELSDEVRLIPPVDPATGDVPTEGPCHCSDDSDTRTEVNSEQPGETQAAGRRRSTGSGVRAHVKVTISLATLLGLNEDPAELEGYGPITAALGRALAEQEGSTWRRLVTDPIHGTLLDYGTKVYPHPKPIKDFTRARDVTCRGVNCEAPAHRCEGDHRIPHPIGATRPDNIDCLCKRSHRLKHEGRWTHWLSDDPNHPPGTILIISPTGHHEPSRGHRDERGCMNSAEPGCQPDVSADVSVAEPMRSRHSLSNAVHSKPGASDPLSG